MLLLWVSPILLFLGLLAARAVTAPVAAGLSLALACAVTVFAGPVPVTASEVAAMALAGAWIALPAVVVILAGLYFTEVLGPGAPAPSSARSLGTTCLFLGPFVETATGFGVGYVVAVGAMLRAGTGPAAALALGAFSQCLVPWGALGIGTRIGATVAGVSPDELGWRIAIVAAPMLWLLGPLFWRIARTGGVPIPRAQRIEDAACLIALSLLLIAANRVLPLELAGLAAIGPVLLYRLARERGRALLSGDALRAAAPYVLLIALLAVAKLVPPVREVLATPAFVPGPAAGQGAPAFAPLASPALALAFAALLGCLAHGRWRALGSALSPTIAKGLRACLMTILLVALAWIMVRAGIAAAFADALRAGAGQGAPLAVPPLGALGGYLTGSNTGAGGLALPVALAVTEGGPALLWLAAATLMAGSAYTALSPVRFAMGQAVSGADRRQTAAALRMLIPFALLTLGVAVVAVAVMT